MKKAVPFILVGLVLGAAAMYVLAPARFPNEQRPAESTSFRAVARQLDAGGDMYAYFNTKRVIRALEGLIDKVGRSLSGQMSPSDAAGFTSVLKLIGRLGLGEISGVGFSSVEVAPELNRATMVVHHDPDKAEGLIWRLGGAAPRALAEIDLLPADTGFAAFADLRLDNVWSWLSAELRESAIPGAADFIRQAEPTLAAQGIKLDALLGSLSGSVGMFVTLDRERRLTFPGGPGETPLTIPEPGLAFVAGIKDPYLFDLLKSKLPMAQFGEAADRRTLRFPKLKAPFRLEPVITATKDILIVTSTPELAEAALQARTKGGLRQSEEFAALARHIPDTGNGFTYFSPRLWNIYAEILGQAAGQGEAGEFNDFFLSLFPKEMKAFGIVENRPDGIVWTYCHNLKPEMLLLMPVVMSLGAASAMALPKIQQTGDAARQAQTLNDLKTVGIAIESYIVDTAEAPQAAGFAALRPLLEPFYLKSLPLKDAWGNDFLYRKTGPDSYQMASPGRDGIFAGWGQKGLYAAEEFDKDLIWSGGSVVFGPGAKQSTI